MVIAELRPLIERATRAFEAFDYAQALGIIEDFFWATFCDNYLELAKPRTYDEDLTEGRLSACATLRLIHRAIVRLLAPFVPYIAEEVWHWAYAQDPGMHDSVHRSPWPSPGEFSAIPAPRHPRAYAVTVTVLEAVRRAKADVSLSMAAPVPCVILTGARENLDAINSVLDDIQRMLKIDAVECKEGPSGETLLQVETETGTDASN
jgi:valyl-tRNA synthetase